MKIKQTSLNRLTKDELSELMLKVSEDVTNAIAPTYGPYGANTLIQSTDSVIATKDGWTVAQYLNYPGNGVLNSLKSLIINCAQSVLLKFGDGTSTVMILAHLIYKRIWKYFIYGGKPYNIKEVENVLKNTVDDICKILSSQAKFIDWDVDGKSIIRNIALVSTNWDSEMAEFIAEIYEKTHNPIIKFENSGNDKTHVGYINGYEIKGELQLPDYYVTDHTSAECVINDPVVLVFNYAIKEDKINLFNMVGNAIKSSYSRSIVILAPDFEPKFIGTLKSLNMERRRRGMEPLQCIPFKYYTHSKTDKDCVDDLCYLFGTDTISENNTDIAEMFADLEDAVRAKMAIDKDETASKDDVEKVYDHCSSLLDAANQYILEVSGTCKSITLTKKHLIAQNFTNANDKVINQRREDLQHELDVNMKECAALSMITEGVRMKRIRLGKLQLNMGVIYVGGFGETNLKGKRDALDDATKACEAAYTWGYTLGGGVAGLVAINHINNVTDNKSELKSTLLNIIEESYRELLYILYSNKFGRGPQTESSVEEIINKSVEDRIPYDIISEAHNEHLISPVSGEIEILQGTMNLVMAMIGANQMVFQDIQSIDDVAKLEAIRECGDVTIETQSMLLKHDKNKKRR